MASKLNIIQIVPRRTDLHDGIGDYGTFLAQALLQRAGVNSIFVVGTPAQIEPPRRDDWKTEPVPHRKGRALSEHLSKLCQNTDAAAVILHVSGYGYQKRGAPMWLLEGMRIWRETRGKCRLLGIFHELFAKGYVWNSSFWLSRTQKHITRKIWDLCDGGLAIGSPYLNQLAAWRPGMVPLLRAMPVFSTIGEPNRVSPIAERPPNMVVFGQPGVELKVYAGPLYELSASIAKELGILKIIDIGARISPLPNHLGAVPIVSLGQLRPQSVSRYLMSCRFGLVNYDIARLEKSSVFAAYAAHGVIPVCIGSSVDPPHGLEEGKHFLRWPIRAVPDLDAMQHSLVQWYEGHSTAKHADLLASWCLTDESTQRSRTTSVSA
jgi:hypothetical protein